jgi:hypothetical protein
MRRTGAPPANHKMLNCRPSRRLESSIHNMTRLDEVNGFPAPTGRFFKDRGRGMDRGAWLAGRGGKTHGPAGAGEFGKEALDEIEPRAA